MEIKGYITNLGKYNEGELIGEWITFPIGEDDLQEVLKNIGCCYYDENGDYIATGYEEYFFTDWETDFVNNFSEYETIDDINKMAEQLKEWDEETFLAAAAVFGIEYIDLDNPDDYILNPNIENDYDLGYYYAIECCCIDFKDNPILENYFDFESYGRDIALEVSGGLSYYGWIEGID